MTSNNNLNVEKNKAAVSKNVPELRFQGFIDAWEQCKLTNITSSYSGLTYSPTDIQDTGTFVLRSSNVKNDQLIDADNVYVNPDIVNSINVKVGDVIIVVRNGSRTLIGKHAIVNEEMPNTVIGAFMSAFRGENGNYVNALLSTENFQKEVHKSLGATINQITGKDFSMMIFPTPKFEEQQKIGTFFKQLDCAITLHQRKLDKLKLLKKGYLQQLFPKNDDKVPRLRFTNFEHEWELRKLGEIASSFEYGLNASAKEFDGTHKYIRITDIDDSSRKFNSESLTSPDIALGSADNYKLKNGDILFARTGASVGKSYIYTESDGLVYYAGFLIRARIKPEFDSNFVFQHTLTSSYESFIRVTSQRSGQPGVNAKEYSIFEIGVPSYEEQQKIGAFFKQLDNIITLHQSKLDDMKSIKQALLQKMFI